MKNKLIKDKAGLISIFTLIMVLSVIIVLIILLTSVSVMNSEESNYLDDINLNYHIKEYEKNIEILTYETLNETITESIKKKSPYADSKKEIKNRLNQKLDRINRNYYINYKIQVTSEILDIDKNDNPFNVNIKYKFNFNRNKKTYSDLKTTTISITGLTDPLPFLKINNMISSNSTNINYENDLFQYFIEKSVNGSSYINASSPLVFRKCPYEPYTLHGKNNLTYDCILNNYYHESSDGSCIFCRLEGKAVCPDYGLETFIISHEINDNNISISSPDHVIFNDNPYNGIKIIISDDTFIFLDNGHYNKYGFY